MVVLGNLDPAAHAEHVFDDWLEKRYLSDEDARDDLVENVREWRDRSRAENRVWTTRSTALAAMTLMYAAWEEGIASCPMEGFDADAVREQFDIDEGYEPVMVLTLGYPEEDAKALEKPRKLRRPAEEIVHYGTFEPETDPAVTSRDPERQASATDD